jgi:nitroreductase/Pyruvate/2-oxoacid:ferredoxin oxidoreductase delta subunit
MTTTADRNALQFHVAKDRCAGCGLCVQDCIASVLALENDIPAVVAGKEADCLRCQHCLTVCPNGAVSIFGLDPDDSRPLTGALPDFESVETLVMGRRSYRKYHRRNVDRALLDRLLEVSWSAPTGSNRRQVHYTLIDDVDVMDRFRQDLLAALLELDRKGAIPAEYSQFGAMARAWAANHTDILFRDATHLLITTVPPGVPSGMFDCLAALTTFDLLAQAGGLGTVWSGLLRMVLEGLLPEFKTRLGIPSDHQIGHMIAFGVPAVHYARTVQRGKPPVNRVG